MSTQGDVFVNGFDSINELSNFLISVMNAELNSYFTEHIALLNISTGFDLHLHEYHEMADDLNIKFSEYRYLIIIDSVNKPKGYDCAYTANYEISKRIKKLLIDDNKQAIALMDMQTLI